MIFRCKFIGNFIIETLTPCNCIFIIVKAKAA